MKKMNDAKPVSLAALAAANGHASPVVGAPPPWNGRRCRALLKQVFSKEVKPRRDDGAPRGEDALKQQAKTAK